MTLRYFYPPFDGATVIEVLLYEMDQEDPGRPILLNMLLHLEQPRAHQRFRETTNHSTVEEYITALRNPSGEAGNA